LQVGDEPKIARMLGTAPESPVAVRFASCFQAHGVDDCGFVDGSFWAGLNERGTLTLRAIVTRAVEWLAGSHVGCDTPEDERQLWHKAEAHMYAKRSIVDQFRELRPKNSEVLAADAKLLPKHLVAAFRPALLAENPDALDWKTSFGVQELSDGIYAFPLLTPEFCDQIAAEVDAFEASKLPCRRPNTMNNYGMVRGLTCLFLSTSFPLNAPFLSSHHTFLYGPPPPPQLPVPRKNKRSTTHLTYFTWTEIWTLPTSFAISDLEFALTEILTFAQVVNEVGMEPLMTDLNRRIIAPLSRALFPMSLARDIDHHHSFIVEYQEGGDAGNREG
jgi:hypothetical protein